MSNFEFALITRVCDTGEWKQVRERVTPEHFREVAAQAAWRWALSHALKHGEAPSRAILRDRFPSFPFESSSDPPAALAERLHTAHVYNVLAVETDKILKSAADDPMAAAELLAKAGSEMRTMLNRATGNIGVDITKQMADEREAYALRASKRGLLGYAWMWDVLNRRTAGAENGSLYAMYGRPKTGKTFYLIAQLAQWWYRDKCRIHLFGREMRTEQLRSRVVATIAKIDYDRYLHGTLTDAEERRWNDATEQIEEMHSFYVDGVSTNGAEAADDMFAKAQDSGADVIGVDGAYFFGERDWEIFAQFTSRFKYNLLHRYQRVGMMTTQGAKQKRAGGDDVAYGDSLLQDVDALIKMQSDPEDLQRVHMSTAGVRDGRPASWQAWRRMCTDFGQAFEEPEEDGSAPPAEVQA